MPRDLRHVQDPLGRASTARAWDMALRVLALHIFNAAANWPTAGHQEILALFVA